MSPLKENCLTNSALSVSVPAPPSNLSAVESELETPPVNVLWTNEASKVSLSSVPVKSAPLSVPEVKSKSWPFSSTTTGWVGFKLEINFKQVVAGQNGFEMI